MQHSLQRDLEQAADHANLLHVVFAQRLRLDGAPNVEGAGAGDGVIGRTAGDDRSRGSGVAGRCPGGRGVAIGVEGPERGGVKPVNHAGSHSKSNE
jgi:hypothetical protein